jgi:ATP-dependent DNA helicase RecG
MTATPIPRTLGQVLYADLDVSDLRTPPEGRIPIRTGIRHPDALGPVWERVRTEAAAGHRTFVVVPLIDEADTSTDDAAPTIFDSSAPAAEAESIRLRELLAPLRVGMVHGRMKAADRDAEMARFRDGELDVLVGTTVVEVGVDVPEATMMVVEGADRFGLAQLHQLRGRVGRGRQESSCVLLYDPPLSETAQKRLDILRRTDDGFLIAETDLELRGGGDALGLKQSGFPDYVFADVLGPHRDLIAAAGDDARLIVNRDPDLTSERGAALRVLQELFDWKAGLGLRDAG